MGIKSLVKQVLTEQQNKRYARLLAAKKVTYDQWIREQEGKKLHNQEVSASLEQLQGDVLSSSVAFVCFQIPQGQIAAGAIKQIAQSFLACTDCSILYGDEDLMEPEDGTNPGVRRLPWFKPDWSPDLLNCSFYFGGLTAMRKALWEEMSGTHELSALGVMLPQSVVNGQQDTILAEEGSACIYHIVDVSRFHRFLRHCVEVAGGYQRNSGAVLHVQQMLFHCYSEEVRDKYRKWIACEEQTKLTKVSNSYKNPNDLLSIIIPSKDHPDILEVCLRAIPQAVGMLPYEVIVVDNGSCEDNRKRIESLIKQCKVSERKSSAQNQGIIYLYRPMEFHFSKMCNLGAEAAKGNLLLFLNDDVELAQPGSLENMAKLAIQKYTGAVGLKLYYPDSLRIQHAGITNLPMGPVHKLQFLEDNQEHYFAYNKGVRNVLAVTAACLMVERDKFWQTGGFAEELRVAFNDVDLCFQLHEKGYYNVCRNDCFAYHHESLSRGDDESSEKLSRLLAERDKLYERNPKLLAVDPYYNIGLGRDGLDTRIRPAFETSGNRPQQVGEVLVEINQAEYRQDACLLFRVEDSQKGCVQGYGVVLGDNNACYDRWLVLKDEQNRCLQVALENQYRPDLEENMQDQMNVGLSGFWIQLTKGLLCEGSYLLGMAVKNRVTGLKLINWSNRSVEVEEQKLQ